MRPSWERLYWLALFLSFVIAELTVGVLWRTSSVENQVLSRDLNDLSLVNELVIATERSEERFRSYMQTGDPADLGEAEAGVHHTDSITEQLRSALRDHELAILASLERARANALNAAQVPIDLRSSGAPSAAVDEAVRAVAPARTALDDRLEQLRQAVRFRFVRRLIDAQQGVRRAFLLMGGAVLVGAAFLSAGLLLLRRTLAQMEQRRRALGEQAAFQEQVMGIVSHDLRSPLTAVIATAEAGLAVERHPGTRARDHRVLRAARRMERVAALLLDTARLSGRSGVLLLPDRVDVRATVEDVVSDYRKDHPDTSLELVWSGRKRFTIDENRLGGTVETMVADVLRPDPSVPIRIEGRVDRDGLSIRIFRIGVRPGMLVPPAPVRMGEDLDLLVAEKMIAGHGGTLERREGEVGLRVPWAEAEPVVDTAPPH